MQQLIFNTALGSGTFGTVYRADLLGQRGFRRPVAVKILNRTGPEMEMFLSRIRDEARLLGLLHDDCILKVLGLARVQGRDAVIMEYIDGVDLQSVIQARLYPPPRALASLGAILAGTLDKTHNARHPSTGAPLSVIHRDVKPANVMLSDRGGLKLLDFGVAKAAFESRESRTGQMVLGTLNYLAPEYIGTGQVSPAVDIYALGLVLLAAATGQEFGQPKLKQRSFEARREEMLAALPSPYAPLESILRGLLDWNAEQRPDGAAAERALQRLEDELTGKGLRSWSAGAVRHTKAQEPPAQDTLGLIGQALELNPSHGENSASWLVSSVSHVSARPEAPPHAQPPPNVSPPAHAPPAASSSWSPPLDGAHQRSVRTEAMPNPGDMLAPQPNSPRGAPPTLAPTTETGRPPMSPPERQAPHEPPASQGQTSPARMGCKAIALALALGMGAGLMLLALVVAAWLTLQ